jgi:alkylated DNA repair dioxygenase AlkB
VFNLLPYAKRKVKEIDLRTDPYPEYISHLKNILEKEIPTYNHLLINVYAPGLGIMPHFDGPMYLPKVVVLSLGGPAIINFTEHYGSTSNAASILLENQSIHIF